MIRFTAAHAKLQRIWTGTAAQEAQSSQRYRFGDDQTETGLTDGGRIVVLPEVHVDESGRLRHAHMGTGRCMWPYEGIEFLAVMRMGHIVWM